MTHDPNPTASVEEKMLAQAARHLQNLTRFKDDIIATDDITTNLQQSIRDFSAGATHGIQDMLASHTRVLDGAFNWFLNKAEERPFNATESVKFALKSQNQVIRTLMAWKRIRDDTRVQDAIERHRATERDLMAQLRRAQKNGDERTEQDWA